MKRKYLLIVGLATFFFIKTNAQSDQIITPEMLSTFHTKFSGDLQSKAIMNAVSSNDIQKLALNRDNLGEVDPYFSHRIKTQGITDQKSTGRCWLFTGLNVFRAKVMDEKGLSNFSFSQNYNFFFDQLEKANLFLEGIIESANKPMDDKMVDWLFKNPIGDGGQWTGVVDIISKYGLVPAEIYPESYNSENTRWMSKFLGQKLKEDGLELRHMQNSGSKVKELRKAKSDMLSEVYRILSICLGEPPSTFSWRYKDKDGNLSDLKTYTPRSFFDEFVNADLNDYIMFMNDPTREYGKLYEIEYDRHMAEGGNWKYINLENEKIKEFASASIQGNDPIYFSCDVGKQLDKDRGYLDVNNYDYGGLFGVEFGMDKAQRISTYTSSSTHGMALMGVDIVDSKPVKWLLENSWGQSGFEGNLIMTDEWFNEYMFRLVIHKKYVAEEVMKILDQDPILLPPWDPMFSPDQ